MTALPTARSVSSRAVRAFLGRTRSLLTIFLSLATPAAAQQITTQFWPGVDTFLRLNENMRIYVPVSKTREGTDDSDQDGTTGLYFDYYASPLARLHRAVPANAPRRHRLLLRAGYGYTTGAGGQPATNTLTVEATGRLSLPWEILASDRNRFDLDFTGGEFDPRYRNRFRLEREVPLGKTTLTPYVYGEFFYSFNDGDWSKTRVAGGFELHVWDRFVPEVYFQRDYGLGGRGDVSGFGLVLSIYLR